MGTNYYAIKKKPRIVEVYDEFHIGKSSIGCKFVFRDNQEFHTFEQFKEWLLNQSEWNIKDEYGNPVGKAELLILIERMQQEENTNDFEYDENRDGYRFHDRDFS